MDRMAVGNEGRRAEDNFFGDRRQRGQNDKRLHVGQIGILKSMRVKHNVIAHPDCIKS